MEQHKGDIRTRKDLCLLSNPKGVEGFKVLQSFAGMLPVDFGYEKELEEMREEKYARFDDVNVALEILEKREPFYETLKGHIKVSLVF